MRQALTSLEGANSNKTRGTSFLMRQALTSLEGANSQRTRGTASTRATKIEKLRETPRMSLTRCTFINRAVIRRSGKESAGQLSPRAPLLLLKTLPNVGPQRQTETPKLSKRNFLLGPSTPIDMHASMDAATHDGCGNTWKTQPVFLSNSIHLCCVYTYIHERS